MREDSLVTRFRFRRGWHRRAPDLGFHFWGVYGYHILAGWVPTLMDAVLPWACQVLGLAYRAFC